MQFQVFIFRFKDIIVRQSSELIVLVPFDFVRLEKPLASSQYGVAQFQPLCFAPTFFYLFFLWKDDCS